MGKGFFATAILLSSISILLYSSLTQNTLTQKMRNTENYVKMNQMIQEYRYRLTQGFMDTVRTSMKNTQGKKPIKRELLACRALDRWINSLESKENLSIEVRAGYIDPLNYYYSEETNLAFQCISSALRRDPLRALGKLKSEATLCIDYLSIDEKSSTATVKDNSYTQALKKPLTGYKPSFIFKINSPLTGQKVVIPSGTVVELKAR